MCVCVRLRETYFWAHVSLHTAGTSTHKCKTCTLKQEKEHQREYERFVERRRDKDHGCDSFIGSPGVRKSSPSYRPWATHWGRDSQADTSYSLCVCVCVHVLSQCLNDPDLSFRPPTPSITKWLRLLQWSACAKTTTRAHTHTRAVTHTFLQIYKHQWHCWSVGGPCTHKKLKPSQEIRNVCLPPRWSSVEDNSVTATVHRVSQSSPAPLSLTSSYLYLAYPFSAHVCNTFLRVRKNVYGRDLTLVRSQRTFSWKLTQSACYGQ